MGTTQWLRWIAWRWIAWRGQQKRKVESCDFANGIIPAGQLFHDVPII